MESPKRTVDLRRLNRQMALKSLYFSGSASRVDLSRRTGLSPATVTNVIGELLEDGVVIETGSVESEGGRPRTNLAVNPEYGYFVGVDFGETHVDLELFDLALRNRGSVRRLVQTQNSSPAEYIDHVAGGLAELLGSCKVAESSVMGVGVGVPGIVERNDAVCVSAPMWNWQSIPFYDMLSRRIATPIFLDNGAKAMSLAEFWFGAGQGIRDIAVILIGTGIGAGIIAEGTLYRGATNSAGEWGHTKIVLDGRECRCGSRGCVEAYGGAPGIAATLNEIAPGSSSLRQTDQIAFISALAEALEQPGCADHHLAQTTLEMTAHYLGAGIANLINLFNPECLLIGGWVGTRLGAPLLTALERVVERYTLPTAFRTVQIRQCQLGQDAICMGAACLALDAFLGGGV